jgi:hypothetical protein
MTQITTLLIKLFVICRKWKKKSSHRNRLMCHFLITISKKKQFIIFFQMRGEQLFDFTHFWSGF